MSMPRRSARACRFAGSTLDVESTDQPAHVFTVSTCAIRPALRRATTRSWNWFFMASMAARSSPLRYFTSDSCHTSTRSPSLRLANAATICASVMALPMAGFQDTCIFDAPAGRATVLRPPGTNTRTEASVPYFETTDEDGLPTVGHAPNMVLMGDAAGVAVGVCVCVCVGVVVGVVVGVGVGVGAYCRAGRLAAAPSAAANTSFAFAAVSIRRLSTFPGVMREGSRSMTSGTPACSAFEVPRRVRRPSGRFFHVTSPSRQPAPVR